MKILSVDTSTPTCTVGIADGHRVLAESVDSSGRTHARHLMAMIDGAIAVSGIPIQAIDGFGVVTGPGTFTGLRIGISTIKGLAFALRRPVVGITSLEALAAQADPTTKLVCPVMDARRGEIYYGFYSSEHGELTQMGDHRVGSPSEVAKRVGESCRFIGKGARLYQETFKKALGPLARFSEAGRDTILAETITGLALKRLRESEAPDLHRVSPCYIRRSDAEVHRGGRLTPPLPSVT